MKIFISADIEGVAGIAAAAETNMATPIEYQPFRQQMKAEVMAACNGAFKAGAKEVLIKDAHGTGRNIIMDDYEVPEKRSVKLIRGWSGHPFGMVQEIDNSFAAVVFIGFHCAAGQAGNPLAHTINGSLFSRISLNGDTASELRLYGLAAAMVGVPVVFVSGDRVTCDEARTLIDGVSTVSTLEGIGPSVMSISPLESTQLIEKGVQHALKSNLPAPITFPKHFILKIEFNRAVDAYARSFYPGVKQVGDRDLEIESEDYLQILTFLRFASRYR